MQDNVNPEHRSVCCSVADDASQFAVVPSTELPNKLLKSELIILTRFKKLY